jgi:hypothetical protein
MSFKFHECGLASCGFNLLEASAMETTVIATLLLHVDEDGTASVSVDYGATFLAYDVEDRIDIVNGAAEALVAETMDEDDLFDEDEDEWEHQYQ